MDWNEDAISRLRALWDEGHSTAEIGRRLGITKNAVVGKAHRLALPPRPSPIRRSEAADHVPRREAAKRSTGPTLPPLDDAPRPAPAPAPRPALRGDPGRIVPAEPRKVYDVRDVIGRIVDGGDLVEVSPKWARNMVVGYARLEGRSVGVVANPPSAVSFSARGGSQRTPRATSWAGGSPGVKRSTSALRASAGTSRAL